MAVPFVPGRPVLEAVRLAKTYPNSPEPVLKQVSFMVREGESVALIGSNGAGKSTLMRCCMQLLSIDEGTIRFLGEDVTGFSENDLKFQRGQVGFIFQYHNLVPRLSVLTNVLHGVMSRRSGPKTWFQSLASQEDRHEAMTCLDKVGLAHLAMRRADSLSGGQSQRVAIARALMQRPRMIMADEPVASLDPTSGDDVMKLFSRLLREERITLFFTSHKLDQALAHSDRILALKRGRVVIDDRSKNLSEDLLRVIYD